MVDKKILSIQDGLSGNLPDITTAKAGRFLITTDTGEMYYEPEDKKRVKINNVDQAYTPDSENAQSGKAVEEAVKNELYKLVTADNVQWVQGSIYRGSHDAGNKKVISTDYICVSKGIIELSTTLLVRITYYDINKNIFPIQEILGK